MSVYVDSSVLLRIILGEPDPLAMWATVTDPVSSELIRLECLRTIDRARVRLGLDDRHIAQQRADVLEAIQAFTLVPLGAAVLDRAAEPMPTILGSLDAIHLASALLVRDQLPGLTFATHDHELGVAALSVGFAVHGLVGA